MPTVEQPSLSARLRGVDVLRTFDSPEQAHPMRQRGYDARVMTSYLPWCIHNLPARFVAMSSTILNNFPNVIKRPGLEPHGVHGDRRQRQQAKDAADILLQHDAVVSKLVVDHRHRQFRHRVRSFGG